MHSQPFYDRLKLSFYQLLVSYPFNLVLPLMKMSDISQGQLLEKYSQQHPDEVLLITIELEGETDQIMIYKGFSSSLTGSTSFNPDIPVLPEQAEIIAIDRLKSPYNPHNPHYLEQGLTWDQMQQRFSG